LQLVLLTWHVQQPLLLLLLLLLVLLLLPLLPKVGFQGLLRVCTILQCCIISSACRCIPRAAAAAPYKLQLLKRTRPATCMIEQGSSSSSSGVHQTRHVFKAGSSIIALQSNHTMQYTANRKTDTKL
jgi:hypothetical protein